MSSHKTGTSDDSSPRTRPAQGRALLGIALAAGLAIRLVLLWHTAALGTRIVDETHYTHLAANLVAGNGFAWSAGALTSMRPPLYPALLASLWTMTGVGAYQAVRLFQVVLALITTALVYQVGARTYGAGVGRVAAVAFWLYPSFIFFNLLILTETVFTFLLVAFLWLAMTLFDRPRATVAILCGLSLGLASLTRSVLFVAPLLLCPYLFATLELSMARRAWLIALVLIGYSLAIVPWTVRNTRLQGVLTFVDTMGGLNLRMGNYEYTPDDRMWDTVALTGTKSWSADLQRELDGRSITEGQRDKWAQRKAIEYMLAHPWTTVRRSFIKFADFWGLEREFAAGVRGGLYTPSAWFAVTGALAITLAYVAVAVCGTAGAWLIPPADRRIHGLLLLPIFIIVGIHTLAFGHSRYHLPLIPILMIYGSAFFAEYRMDLSSARVRALVGAGLSITLLVGIWVQEVAIADVSRIRGWLEHVR